MNEYDFAIGVVREAGQLLLSARGAIQVGHKGDDSRDTLTNVDLEINSLVTQKLKEAFPGHGIVSEEGGGVSGSEFQWLLDPIDGSANFSRALPHFSICLGLLRNGVPMVGAIYNPVTDELFSFEQGHGAFLNGTAIRASVLEDLHESHALLTVGRTKEVREWGGEMWKVFLANFNKTKGFGASALDLCFLAASRVEVVLYGRLTTADVAAAIGLVREAGGEVYTLSGEPVEFSRLPQPVVATANKALLHKLLPLLRQNLFPS